MFQYEDNSHFFRFLLHNFEGMQIFLPPQDKKAHFLNN